MKNNLTAFKNCGSIAMKPTLISTANQLKIICPTNVFTSIQIIPFQKHHGVPINLTFKSCPFESINLKFKLVYFKSILMVLSN